MEFRAKQCILTKINALQDRRAHSLPPSPRNQCWDVVSGPWQHRGGHAMMQSNIDFGGRGRHLGIAISAFSGAMADSDKLGNQGEELRARAAEKR